jgi:hypothetical protein
MCRQTRSNDIDVMPTKVVHNLSNPSTKLTPQDVAAFDSTSKCYREVPEEHVKGTLTSSLSSGQEDSFAVLTSKIPISEEDILQQWQFLKEQLEERDYRRHIHNLKSSSLDSFFIEFMKHLNSTLPVAPLLLINGCKTFADFHRIVSSLPAGERKNMILRAAESYSTALGLKRLLRFWTDAEEVYTTNNLRNKQEHCSVLDSAEYFLTRFKDARNIEELPAGAYTTLALAKYAKQHHLDLEESRRQRREEEKRSLGDFVAEFQL